MHLWEGLSSFLVPNLDGRWELEVEKLGEATVSLSARCRCGEALVLHTYLVVKEYTERDLDVWCKQLSVQLRRHVCVQAPTPPPIVANYVTYNRAPRLRNVDWTFPAEALRPREEPEEEDR